MLNFAIILLIGLIPLPVGSERIAASPDVQTTELYEDRVAVDPFNVSLGMDNAKLTIHAGSEIVWQRPENTHAILLLLHGCGASATDFFPRNPACLECQGGQGYGRAWLYPEESKITQAGLQAGFTVMAVSSIDRVRTRCWQVTTSLETNEDLVQLEMIFQTFIPRERLDHLPLYVLGIGQGGIFSSLLPHRLTGISALALHNSPCATVSMRNPLPQGALWPPTLFMHMPRDERTAQQIQLSIQTLREKGTLVAELKLNPRRVVPFYFCNITEGGISPRLSVNISQALLENKIINPEGFLYEDPSKSNWREALRKAFPPSVVRNISLDSDQSAIAEGLDKAFAFNGVVGDYITWTLSWMKGDRRQPDFQIDLFRLTCDGVDYSPMTIQLRKEQTELKLQNSIAGKKARSNRKDGKRWR